MPNHLPPRSRPQTILLIAAATAAATAVFAGGGGAIAASAWLPAAPTNWSTVVSEHPETIGTVTRGVQLSRNVLDTVAGRQPLQTLTIDASDANVRVGVVGAGSTLINPSDETVSSMAARTGAVAGVNGGFFDVNATGQPIAGQIVDGEIWKSPQHNHDGTFVVRADGTMAIQNEEFTGTITDGTQSHALRSINWTADATGDDITEITSRLGGPVDVSKTHPIFASGTTSADGATLTVTSIGPVDTLPALQTGSAGLLASATGGQWLTDNIHVGDAVSLSTATAPDANIRQLLQGPGQPLIRGGELTSDLQTGNPAGLNPETAIGLDATGRHLTMVTLDGRGTTSTAVGPTVPQVAGYMKQLGVQSALLLDGGGSTTMVAREPGNTSVSVENNPSDAGGVERAVGNSILVWTTATSSGAPATASINHGEQLTAISGVATSVPASAADAAGNPLPASGVRVTVAPASLGSWAGGVFTPRAAGSGTITVTDGAATAKVPVTVEKTFRSLALTPADPDLDNGGTATLTLTGTSASGASVPVAATAATWSVDHPELGSVDSSGVFTAAADGSGLATVSAKAGGVTAIAHIAVGTTATELAPMDASGDWSYSIKNGATATVGTTDDVPPGSAHEHAIRLDYAMPGTSGVHQMVISPQKTITIDKDAAGQAPTALALWIKDVDPVHDAFQFATSYKQGNGQSATLYNTGVRYGDWSLLKTPIPAGTVFPLTLTFVDMLSINPTKASSGSLELSGLQALYSARPATSPDYTAIPDNPDWLQYVNSPADFTGGGQTILMGDDAHMVAGDPGSASSNVMDQIAARAQGKETKTADGRTIAPLPENARPTLVQMLGDMADDGAPADLAYAKQKIAAIGVPYHDLVGNHEITQGAAPENGNFDSAFGDTHYAYTAGAATVIATDNAHTSILSSDAFQAPAEQQYPWLVQQLDQASTPVVIVATHMPAYDPFPAKNSQFSDRWEAQQYLQIVQHYRDTHPDKHVIMVYGHARGFSEQLLDATGAASASGVPQFVFADLGMPAYTTPQQGGFYHFGLVHVTDDGKIQFAVEPVLGSIGIDQPTGATAGSSAARSSAIQSSAARDAVAPTVSAGKTLRLSAHGVNVTGDNLDPVTVPIAAPASHVWASSDPAIATVDPATGVVTAKKAGTVTVTVEAGGLTAETTVVVAPADAGTPPASPPATPPATTPPATEPPTGSPAPAGGPGTTHPSPSDPAATDPSAAGSSGDLASTGSDVLGLTTAGAVAVALIVGGGIFYWRRRRSTTER